MRKKYFILPSFQIKWISRFLLLVAFSTVLSSFVTVSYIHLRDKKERGTFFYVTDEMGTDPLTTSRSKILLFPIAVSGMVSLALTFILSLLYSHRLAGPIFRLKRELETLIEEKDLTKVFQLRKGDELDELVLSLNSVIQNLREKIKQEDQNRQELAEMAKKLLEDFTGYEKLEDTGKARQIALIKSILNRLKMPMETLKV